MNPNKFLGNSFVSIMLVLLFGPMITHFNSLPSSDTITALGLFFWVVMAITILYFMGQALSALLE